MKRITPQRVVLFVVVMAAVAFVVYLPRYRRSQQQNHAALQRQRAAENQATARKAVEAAETQRAQYVSTYVNRGFTPKPSLKTVAIAAEFQNDRLDRPIADALARHLENENLAVYTSFFKSAFYADGLFSDILAGSTEPIYNLELTNKLDALMLAHEQVQYSTNGAEVDNVVTANARLEVAFLPLGVMRVEQSWTFLANGAGFSTTEARSNAQERLIKQIEGATNLTLLSLPSENQLSYP